VEGESPKFCHRVPAQERSPQAAATATPEVVANFPTIDVTPASVVTLEDTEVVANFPTIDVALAIDDSFRELNPTTDDDTTYIIE